MAEGTYDFEVMRAELLGIKPPNKEEFEIAREERLEIERAELEAAEANVYFPQNQLEFQSICNFSYLNLN